MSSKYSRSIALLALIMSFVWAAPAQAQLTLSLMQPSQDVQPGQTISFAGTLTNNGSSTIFLNGDNLGILGLGWDDTPFILGAPLSLAAGTSFSGDLFDVTANALVNPATYSGSFSILGGVDSNTYDVLVSQPFQVIVPQNAPVPEAPSMVSLGLMLVFGGVCLWRVRHRR